LVRSSHIVPGRCVCAILQLQFCGATGTEVCIWDALPIFLRAYFLVRAAADVLMFALLAFVGKVTEDVVKHAVDTVAVVVVVTVDVVKEIPVLVTADERRSLLQRYRW